MHPRSAVRSGLALAALAAALVGGSGSALADGGFQLNRYVPSTAGEAFFGVDRPWYSSTRRFAIGLTLDYAHDPLVFGTVAANGSFSPAYHVVEHSLYGHLDAGVSFLDRFTVSASLPVRFNEWGGAMAAGLPDPGISAGGAAVGDPRVGIMARLWNHADSDPISLHFGVSLWIPIGSDSKHAGDTNVRVLPRLVLGGLLADHMRWSLSGGFLWRPDGHLGTQPQVAPAGSTAGPEFQVGAGFSFTDSEKKLNVGPELAYGTIVTGGHPFDSGYSSLEVLVGAQYLFFDALQVGVAVGTGLQREPGTPDVRGLLRIGYAPMGKADLDRDGVRDADDACPNDSGPESSDQHTTGCPDRDKDGIVDRDDLCPDEPKGDSPDAARAGCPGAAAAAAADTDHDGVTDDKDACVDVPAGAIPDAARAGCPADKDHDGVIDEKDACVDVPQGPSPDANKAGCPQNDKDGDGIADDADKCPGLAAGKVPDPARNGCPLDSDRDGIYDESDACVSVPAGLNPDPAADKKGCPLPDKDGDNVVDAADACPDKAGAPDPDPKKNGCPGLVQITGCQIVIKDQVYFATGKDVILPKSFPVLTQMSNALKLSPQIKRISVDGHTDSAGKLEANMDLSDRRAKSVMKWLSSTGGVAADRIEAHGYGPTRPIADNKTAAGKSANRRVEFNILDPVCSDKPKAAPAPAAPAAKPAAAKGKKGR